MKNKMAPVDGSRIGLAEHYGNSAVKAAKWGQVINSENLARLAAHHFMNVRGNVSKKGFRAPKRDPGGLCGCEYGQLPTSMFRPTAAETRH